MDTTGAENYMLNSPSIERLKFWSQSYSSTPHLSGDIDHATSIRDLWRSYGISAELERYDVLQNFPIRTGLTLHDEFGRVHFEASLREDAISEDPTSSPSNGLPAFHGFSANGTVTAELVYVNFGTLEDFQLLQHAGVPLAGKIALCKYGKVFRGLKVRAAEQFGCTGMIIYNDPQEDGLYTPANGYKVYPDGPARHPSAIQRGSVDFFSVCVGDPTSPGWASLPGTDSDIRRVDPHHAIPGIPSLPIGYSDATYFLDALNGHGLSPESLGADWKGCISGISYSTGPSTLQVTLTNNVEYKITPIYDVIGKILGTTDECIVLGNHHDSWCCGAIDPISGSAAINEVAKGLSELVQKGWQPRRTIILASWDDEEYGLVGSTEWVEDHAKYLSQSCVAYINVDEATNGGDILGVESSPLLGPSIIDITKRVPSPLQTGPGHTMYSDWLALTQELDSSAMTPLVNTLGTGSDYTAFQHHLGIPSVDLLINRRRPSSTSSAYHPPAGVYPYHSNYDSYTWLLRFGDPSFLKHQAMSRLFGALAVRLASVDVLPWGATEYAIQLSATLAEVKHALSSNGEELIAPLEAAIGRFTTAANKLDERAASGEDSEDVNKRYRAIEKGFLVKKGLDGREWYKHVTFAPALWKGYAGIVFPGLQEALSDGDMGLAKEWVETLVRLVDDVASIMSK